MDRTTTAGTPSQDPVRGLAGLSRELAAEPHPATALWRLVEHARHTLDLDRVGVYAYDRVTHSLRHVTGVSPEGEPEFAASVWPLDDEPTPLKHVARGELPYYFSNRVRTDYPHYQWRPGVTAHAIVPIRAGNGLVGALCTDNCLRGQPFSETLVEPLFLYAGLAALPLFALYQEQERQRAELLRRHVSREVIQAVTGGKMLLLGESEISEEWTGEDIRVHIAEEADIRRVREAVQCVGERAGLPDARAADLALCASEAATNALLHGGGGTADVAAEQDRVRVRVMDHGRGIDTEDLPRATLQKGWSTRRSMGLGFTIIHETADRVLLHTGPGGTTVIIEVTLEPVCQAAGLLALWEDALGA